jgi:hypothetical protein
VSVEAFAALPGAASTIGEFLAGLPDVLAVRGLREAAKAVVEAHRAGKTVAMGMGAHVIKVGLSPIIIDLMERGVVSAIAMNGACVVHDFEAAYAGCTSEDVDGAIGGGAFGMAEETGRLVNRAVRKDGARLGLGGAVGAMIAASRFPHRDKSILAASSRLGVPATVHVAIGTDILHMHPHMDGAATGEATLRDFRTFSSVVATLEGGVYLNIGSAVILPEVFLKALTLARNLGARVGGTRVRRFTTVNMDFIQHYRPLTNVVRRPTADGGRGISLTGHHEIMVPLLYAAIMEGLGRRDGR